MLDVFESDELLESDDAFEWDESDESDERARRRGRARPVRTAKGGGAVPKRPPSGFATKAELAASANTLDRKIVVNSEAIKTVNTKIADLSAQVSKNSKNLGGRLNEMGQMSMLLPLLTMPQTRKVTTGITGTEIAANDRVVVESGDTLTRLLPMLLMSGSMGGGSGQSGGMFGGDNSALMMVAMVMAMRPPGT
jgi:hypothetical protein